MAKKRPNLYLRLWVLRLCSFAVLAGPLFTVLLKNRERYFISTEACVKLSVGASIAVVMLLLSLAGKLRLPRRVVVVALVTLMAWLLDSILKDLFLLSSMVLAGVAADSLVMEPLLRHTEEALRLRRAADANAEAIAATMEGVSERHTGRV